MADKKDPGRDGPPQQGGQRGRRQQRGRGAAPDRIDPESRALEWLQDLDRSPPEAPLEDPIDESPPARLPRSLPEALPRTVSLPAPFSGSGADQRVLIPVSVNAF